MPGVRWNTLTRDDVRSRLKGGAVVVLPTAATEQHGPHLPTGHDSFAVEYIAHHAAALAGTEVVVAPTLVFGSSQHHVPFGGTLSLSTETYYRVVTELVESAIAGGGHTVLLLNGHGGNQELNQLVVRDVALAHPPDAGLTLAAASYWQVAGDALARMPELDGIRVPGHAGQFETATQMAQRADLVHLQRAARDHDRAEAPEMPGVRIETSGLWQSFDGYTDRPDLATSALGEAILATVIREVAALMTRLGPGIA